MSKPVRQDSLKVAQLVGEVDELVLRIASTQGLRPIDRYMLLTHAEGKAREWRDAVWYDLPERYRNPLL